jgi:hypothetical protein
MCCMELVILIPKQKKAINNYLLIFKNETHLAVYQKKNCNSNKISEV